MKGQGDGEGKGAGEDGWSRGYVRVTGLPEVTDGNERETGRLKSPWGRKGSKDRASDGKHLGETDLKKNDERRELRAKELDVRGQGRNKGCE